METGNQQHDRLLKLMPTDLAIVQLEFSLCSFERKLTSADLGLSTEVTKELMSLGTKKVLSLDAKAPGDKMKREGEKILAKVGFKIAGNLYGVPQAEYHSVMNQLQDLSARFSEWHASLVEKYAEKVEAHARFCEEQRPGFGDIVRNAAFSRSYIEKQIEMTYSGEEGLVNTLGDSMLESFAKAAKEKFSALKSAADNRKGDMAGKMKIDRGVLRWVEEQRGKAAGLVFIDARAQAIVSRLNDFTAMVKKVPQKKNLDETHLGEFLTVLAEIQDVNVLAEKLSLQPLVHQPELFNLDVELAGNAEPLPAQEAKEHVVPEQVEPLLEEPLKVDTMAVTPPVDTESDNEGVTDPAVRPQKEALQDQAGLAGLDLSGIGQMRFF